MTSLRNTELMSGKYSQMFDIPVISANKNFVSNPYVSGKCQPCSVTSFSLTQGALPCQNYNDKVLVWSNDGTRVATRCTPVVKNGCFSLQWQ